MRDAGDAGDTRDLTCSHARRTYTMHAPLACVLVLAADAGEGALGPACCCKMPLAD